MSAFSLLLYVSVVGKSRGLELGSKWQQLLALPCSEGYQLFILSLLMH